MENLELREVLLSEKTPSRYFEALRRENGLQPRYTELARLVGVLQDPIYHPEGDVWAHTMEVLDRGAVYRERVKNPYGFLLAALTHDMGKAVATAFFRGRWHAYGHETLGLPLIEAFLHRQTEDEALLTYVLRTVPLHMKPGQILERTPLRKTNQMFDAVPEPEALLYLAMADKPRGEAWQTLLWSRLEQYRATMAAPCVTEADLTGAGIPAGKLEAAAAFAHKLRLAGIERDSVLKQTTAQFGK